MAQIDLTYNDLVIRYGKNLAFDFLVTIEKLAKVQGNITELDEDIRLQRALKALDDNVVAR